MGVYSDGQDQERLLASVLLGRHDVPEVPVQQRGGRRRRDRCMFFPSKEAAVISAAAMGVEVWDVRPDARWRAAERDMRILA